MIEYETKTSNKKQIKLTIIKEKLIKRRKFLNKFRKKVQKSAKINEEKQIKSLEYSKHKFVK